MSEPAQTTRDKTLMPRTAARLGAVQALYQMDVAHSELADVLAEFGSTRLGEDFEGGQCGEADFPFLRDLVTGVLREQLTIDPMINAVLAEGWALNRLDATLRAILRAAAYELTSRRDVPVRVVINEYVQVTHAFFGTDEPRLVNGVLDRLGRSAREKEFG
ncbi:N utilization substance protein B [Rhodoligotrophos appendicifer]|uniref:transcription antitermination factor NusB n=1 Tax=Rhodoligotrophos appendicifer TaxID=987056 RepID=UPI001184E4CD|nr:transcription antitermination factor NusB [Rhodoligotrophos appendicifer]